MERLLSRTVFSVGERDYAWADVVVWGLVSGEWAALEQRTREGMSCLLRAKDSGEEPSPKDLEAAAARFRYQRRLVAADDTEAWLEARDLDVEDWMEHVRRSVLRDRWAGELPEIGAAYPVPAGDVEQMIWIEGICSGALSAMAEGLADRAAVFARARVDSGRDPNCPQPDVDRVAGRLPRSRDGVLGIPRKEIAARAEAVACFAIVYERLSDQVGAPELVDSEIETHALDWIRFDCREVALAEEGAAREAALLVRQDGLDLDEAAATAHATPRRERIYLEDADPAIRDRLLGAQEGDLVGPIPTGGVFVLLEVLARVAPTTDDPAVRARARDQVLGRTVGREVVNRVRWHETL
ncbi:MAG: hypothetical protein ACRDH6_02845 [Actinomycetota bacterium]